MKYEIADAEEKGINRQRKENGKLMERVMMEGRREKWSTKTENKKIGNERRMLRERETLVGKMKWKEECWKYHHHHHHPVQDYYNVTFILASWRVAIFVTRPSFREIENNTIVAA